MTKKEHTELYNKMVEALGDKLFILILPDCEKDNHKGNYMMSNIEQSGVHKLLIRLSERFSPNKKVDHFLNSNEKDNQN